jgi:TnsA endonuclease N terminal
MPVRKIPKNHLFVTGSFASRKNGQMGGFESLLEKEYMLLLDFDDAVKGFEEQPVTIPMSGVPRGYTPDVLVRFRADPATGRVRAPLLTEIKHSDDLKKNAEKYAPKFAAAEQYAAERGWQFGLTTEKEIRTVRLATLKFLREYRNIEPGEENCIRILKLIDETDGTASVHSLLKHLVASDEDQLYWLPVIWNMVLMRRVVTTLDVAIGNDIILKLPEKMP